MAERFSTALRNEILKASGSSYADALLNGTIHLYSGPQPSDADAAETGDKLVEITESSLAFTSGVATNGLEYDVAAAGVLSPKVGEVWSGVGTAACGSAGKVLGWGRFYANTVVTGTVTTTGVRFDFAISQSGQELEGGNTTVIEGETVTISSLTITLPSG